MVTARILKIVSIGIALLLMQACSHPIEIEGRGDVTSNNLTRGCSFEESRAVPKLDKCAKNLVVGDYRETYYAAARPGWKFKGWVNYCKDVIPPPYSCSFNIPAATVKKYWGQTMPPLRAVFVRHVDLPITGDDIVTVNDKEWAQPDLFTNLSWNQINAVCSGGPCVAGGRLNGRDMTGWTWADSGEVAGLFNSYGVLPPLGMYEEKTNYPGIDAPWATAFFASGFRQTYAVSEYNFIEGWNREGCEGTGYGGYYCEYYGGVYVLGLISHMLDWLEDHGASDFAAFGDKYEVAMVLATRGGWFYRTP